MKIIAMMLCILCIIILFHVHLKRIEGLKYIELARISEGLGKFDDTVYFALKGLEANPYNILLNNFAGVALLKKKMYKESLSFFNTSLKYYPNQLNLLVNMTYSHVYIGNKEKSLEFAERIERIKPSYVDRINQ